MVLVRVTEHYYPAIASGQINPRILISRRRIHHDKPFKKHHNYSVHPKETVTKKKRSQGLSHQFRDFPHILRLQFRERSLFRDCPHGLLSNQYLERSRASVSSDFQLAIQFIFQLIGHAHKRLSHLRHRCSDRRRGGGAAAAAFFRRLFLHRRRKRRRRFLRFGGPFRGRRLLCRHGATQSFLWGKK